MTVEEVGKLLGFAALYDSRRVEVPDVMAWHRVVGDLPYADAEEAVAGHYRDSRERIMPADIRERVDAVRRRRLLENPPPDCPPEIVAQGHDAYVDWHRKHGRAIANNEPLPRQIGGTP